MILVRMGALLLTAVAISANFTNYGPLIPVLQGTLHINGGEAGLFSTLLYGGIACSYLPGGMLADRYGARRVLLVSLHFSLHVSKTRVASRSYESSVSQH